VAGAEIFATEVLDKPVARSDRFGVYRYPGIVMTGEHLVARHHGLITEVPQQVRGQRLNLRLSGRVASIFGHVTDTEGLPIEGVRVGLVGAVGDRDWAAGPDKLTYRTGAFRFDGLPAGFQSINISFEKRYFVSDFNEDIRLAPGEMKALPTMVMRRLGKPISGRVLDAFGQPVGSMEVGVQGLGEGATTDRLGRFRLARGIQGNNWLIAIHGNKALAYKEAHDGQADVVIRLRPDGVHEPSISSRSLIGRRAPELKPGTWLQGPPVALAQLRGKPVVLDFWGVHCLVCVRELPFLERLKRRYGPKGAAFIGICDPLDGGSHGPAILKKAGVTYPNLLDSETRDSEPATHVRYGYRGLPHVLLIGSDGRVLVDGSSLGEVEVKLKAMFAPRRPAVGHRDR
jgi:thiol-disulfide isomerase/thioredoxin